MTGLPMPRNPSLLDPATPRVRHRTVDHRFPFPIPNGWFIVARTSAVDVSAVVPLHYFGRDLVLFRTERGDARLVDAYCPHLGAHLAVGGKVEGDHLRCPFHGWCFDGGSGTCIEIPYSTGERIPARAALRTYPVIERGGMVWAWHHLLGGEPFFELPVVAEFDDEDWTEPLLVEFDIATCCQEMAENNHDFAHFKYVHGTDEVPDAEELIDGTYKRTVSPGLVRETFGLGLGVVRVPDVVTFLSSVTPVDEENVHVRWLFTTPMTHGPDFTAGMAEQFSAGVTQDIPIWENKLYRPRPVLTRGESGIVAHRTWAAQFYSEIQEDGDD